MMLRSAPAGFLTRSALRLGSSQVRATAPTARRFHHFSQRDVPRSKSPFQLALVPYRPISTSLQRPNTASTLPSGAEKTYEKQPGEDKSVPHSGESSSVQEVSHEKVDGNEKIKVVEEEEDIDMFAEVKSDWRVVKETFAFQDVPQQALVIGMAGVTPYLLTSLTTVALAWDINHADLDGVGVFLSGANAEWLLDIIEPIQIGYGAVIISFLGAIHWGLEWAKFGGTHGYKRYAIGVIAPAVAWPTILFPVEAALISQFLAFLFLYYTDARTVVQGWSPSWYTTYRFILTFFVGASLVLSLVGRGQIADKAHRLPDPGHQQVRLRELQAQLHAEEQQYIREQAAKRAEDEEAEEGDSLTEAEAEEEE